MSSRRSCGSSKPRKPRRFFRAFLPLCLPAAQFTSSPSHVTHVLLKRYLKPTILSFGCELLSHLSTYVHDEGGSLYHFWRFFRTTDNEHRLQELTMKMKGRQSEWNNASYLCIWRYGTKDQASRIASLIPNLFWGYDLVCELILQHAVLVYATFMGISIWSDYSLQGRRGNWLLYIIPGVQQLF